MVDPPVWTGSLADFLSRADDIVTAVITWCGSVVTTVQAEPLLQVFILLPLVGLGIGFLKRLIRI